MGTNWKSERFRNVSPQFSGLLHVKYIHKLFVFGLQRTTLHCYQDMAASVKVIPPHPHPPPTLKKIGRMVHGCLAEVLKHVKGKPLLLYQINCML